MKHGAGGASTGRGGGGMGGEGPGGGELDGCIMHRVHTSYIRKEEVGTPPMSKFYEFMMSLRQECDLISMQMHSPPSFLGAFSYIHELELVDSY